jgi:hypothetical protein
VPAILTFDAGFNLGWSLVGRPKIFSGSHKLPGSGRQLGLALAASRVKVRDLIQIHKPDVVAIAAPFISRKATPDALRPLFAFYGQIEEEAFYAKVRCVEVYENEARGAFLGLGNVPKGTDLIKKAVMQACKDRNWPCPDNHAADSLCVGAFVLEQLDPDGAYETTPLFQQP